MEPTVEVLEEVDWMEVLLEIGDAGDAGEADRTEVLSVDQHPGGAGEIDGMDELSRSRTMVARLLRRTCCRRFQVPRSTGFSGLLDAMSEIEDRTNALLGNGEGSPARSNFREDQKQKRGFRSAQDFKPRPSDVASGLLARICWSVFLVLEE